MPSKFVSTPVVTEKGDPLSKATIPEMAAQIAAHNTRDKKVILSPDQILAAHKQIADEFGNQAERAVAEARDRRKQNVQERRNRNAAGRCVRQ